VIVYVEKKVCSAAGGLVKAPILLCVLCMFFVFSCASMIKPVYIDDTLPEEQLATVWFVYGIKFTAYNGISMDKKVLCIKIPAGDAEFVVDVAVVYGNTRFTVNDAVFRYNFEAGKEYDVWFSAAGEDRKDIDDWGVELFNGPHPSIGSPNVKNLIAFVPFLNVGGPNTILN
jgi:hypothetical protein